MEEICSSLEELNIKNDRFETLLKSIDNCKYLQKKKITPLSPVQDYNSLSYLISSYYPHIILSQSQKIKLGFTIEKYLTQLILDNYDQIINLKGIFKDKRELDHLWQMDNKIIYSEVKTNINLDTEKSLETCRKIIEIQQNLTKFYPNCQIQSFLLCARYIHSKDIKDIYKKKYLSREVSNRH